MVKKAKKAVKKEKKTEKKVEETEEDGGMSLDDAFGDDENVEYAKPKEKKAKKGKGIDEDELDDELDQIERSNGSLEQGEYSINASKPVAQVKKGDKITIDGKQFTVDSHYVLIDHKTTKEMAIELYDDTDRDYQLRYFDDQIETTLEFYELQEIMYIKRRFAKVGW